MASRATRHILAVLSVAAGVGKVVSEQGGNHFARQHGLNMEAAAMDAMALWPEAMDQRAIDSIVNRLVRLEVAGFFGTADALEASSFLIDRLVEVVVKVKDAKKRAGVAAVLDAVERWHRFSAPVKETAAVERRYEKGALYAAVFGGVQ